MASCSVLKDVQFWMNLWPLHEIVALDFYDQIEFLSGARLLYVGFPFFLACGSVSVRQSDFCHHINQISFGDIFSELNSKFLYCLWAVYFLNCELHNYLEASLVYLLFPVVCMFCLLSYSTKYTWMYLWWLSNFDTSHIQREKERKKNILSRMIK